VKPKTILLDVQVSCPVTARARRGFDWGYQSGPHGIFPNQGPEDYTSFIRFMKTTEPLFSRPVLPDQSSLYRKWVDK
jgi:hypothetical protein